MKKITLKEKGKLRELIHESYDTTMSLDKIEVYADGSWSQMSGSTYSKEAIRRQTLGSFGAAEYGESENKAISDSFRMIEDELNFSELDKIVDDMKDEHPECKGCHVFESIINHILAGEKNYSSMDCEDCDAVKEKQFA